MGAAISSLSDSDQKKLYEDLKFVYDKEYEPKVARGEMVDINFHLYFIIYNLISAQKMHMNCSSKHLTLQFNDLKMKWDLNRPSKALNRHYYINMNWVTL